MEKRSREEEIRGKRKIKKKFRNKKRKRLCHDCHKSTEKVHVTVLEIKHER